MTRYVAIASFSIVVALIAVPWYRRRRHLSEHELLQKILPGRFSDLQAYLRDSDEVSPCEDFWTLSGGIRGLAERLYTMFLIVRLLQHQVRAGRIAASDATDVWTKVYEQVWFSALAIPESCVCAIWKRLPRWYSLGALRSHYEMRLRAFAACTQWEDVGLEFARLQ